MSISLIPLADSVLGNLGWRAVERLNPGSFLQQLLGGGSGDPTTADHSATDNESPPRVDLLEALPEFAAVVRKRLAEAGIQLTEPLVLKDDGDGGIMVEGEHSDRQQIEDLLRGDSELQSEFQDLTQAAHRQRDHQPLWYDNRFSELRLDLTATSAAIRFE